MANVTVYLPQVDTADERTRLASVIEEVRAYIISLEAKLANTEFTSKAPAKVVNGMRAKKEEYEKKVAEIEKQLKAL